MAYETGTLTGTYQSQIGGTPAEGYVEIIPSVKVIKDTTGNVVLTGRRKIELDAEGSFTTVLPATDDPTLNPTGFGYTIVAKLRHQHLPAVSFQVPSGSVLDVEDVTPVDPATFTPTATYVEAADLAALEAEVAGKADTGYVDAFAATLPDTYAAKSVQATVETGRLADAALSGAYVGRNGAATVAPAYNFLSELRRNTRDLTWLHIGDSTSRGTKPWPRTVLDTLGQNHPARTTEYVAPLDIDPLTYQPAEVRQVGTGSRKITLYNASRSGKGTRYTLGANWATLIDSIPTPDLITVSHGHNDAVTRQFFHGDYAALVESLRAQFPEAEVILIGQNPEQNNTNQRVRAEVVANLARQQGYGFANIHDLFYLRPGGFADLMLDNAHPTEAGHDLTAAEAMRLLTWNDRAHPITTATPSILAATENLAPEGLFRGWSGTGAPSGWVTTGPVALSKDVVNFETKGYGVKVAASGASGVLQYTLPAERLPLVKGKQITLAVRLFVGTGQPSGSGRIGFTDGTQLVSNGNLEGQGGFRWAVFTGTVSKAATLCRLMIYAADSAATSGGEITVDRVICARGSLPRDYFDI